MFSKGPHKGLQPFYPGLPASLNKKMPILYGILGDQSGVIDEQDSLLKNHPYALYHIQDELINYRKHAVTLKRLLVHYSRRTIYVKNRYEYFETIDDAAQILFGNVWAVQEKVAKVCQDLDKLAAKSFERELEIIAAG
ncbi:MAG: hypothetical protein Q9218_008096, partial [Villophora microphyllina]